MSLSNAERMKNNETFCPRHLDWGPVYSDEWEFQKAISRCLYGMIFYHMILNWLEPSCDRQPLSFLTETSAAAPQQAPGLGELLHHSLTAVSPCLYRLASSFSHRVNVLHAILDEAACKCCFLPQSLSSTATRCPTVYLWSAFLPISCQLLLVF